MYIGEIDKNGKHIKVGDTVRFKFHGPHYYTETVTKCTNGYRPFAPMRVEVGFGDIDPKECEVI